jgi:hypothetical protein
MGVDYRFKNGHNWPRYGVTPGTTTRVWGSIAATAAIPYNYVAIDQISAVCQPVRCMDTGSNVTIVLCSSREWKNTPYHATGFEFPRQVQEA